MTSTYKRGGFRDDHFVLSLSVHAQSASPKLKKFAKDGISFDYPADYSVTDESTDEAQQLILARASPSA